MHNPNLRKIDLNLLVILQALLKQRHVSRAAQQLNMSQPAVSRALQRLRDTMGDPLLVHTREGYDLSARAQQIEIQLNELLQSASNLIQPPTFNPAKAEGTLRLTGVDLEMALYLPKLTKQLHLEAPKLKIELVPQSQDHFQLLDRGEVHFSLSGLEPSFSTDHFHRTLIDKMHTVCLMDKDHPFAEAMTLQQYVSSRHGMVSLTGIGPGIMDDELERLGLTRHLALRLCSFMSVADFCEGTDLIFVLPTRLAEHIAKGRHLKIRALPEGIPSHQVKLFLYWHSRHHHDPLCNWVRDKVTELFRNNRDRPKY